MGARQRAPRGKRGPVALHAHYVEGGDRRVLRCLHRLRLLRGRGFDDNIRRRGVANKEPVPRQKQNERDHKCAGNRSDFHFPKSFPITRRAEKAQNSISAPVYRVACN